MTIVDLSSLPNAQDDYVAFISSVCDRLEFDYGSYAAINLPNSMVHGYANYSDDWKLHYMQREMRRVDPTLHKSARSIAPVDWQRFDRDDKFHAVFRDASDFGVTPRGLTVPVRGPYGDCALFSVTRSCSDNEWDALKKNVMTELQMVAVHLHDSVMQDGVVTRALYAPQISMRETEVLQWIAAGKSQADIAEILTISSRTVEVHLRSAREKLGALTTPQAIGRAVSAGLIQPS